MPKKYTERGVSESAYWEAMMRMKEEPRCQQESEKGVGK